MFRLIPLLLIPLLLMWLPPGTLHAAEPPSNVEPGEIIVKFKSKVSRDRSGLRTLEQIPQRNLHRLEVAPGTEAATIASLRQQSDVLYAGYNHRIHALERPDDPHLVRQTSLITNLDILPAWEITTGAEDVIIAILDSGVDLDHPDLAANLLRNAAGELVAANYIEPGLPPADQFSHGTHVAGIAAAVSNNNEGIAGVSWQSKIMPIKVLGSTGQGTSFDLAEGIYFAVDSGADILNLSVGSNDSSWPCNMPEVEEAFEYAVAAEVLIFAAAGNEGIDKVNCPGAYSQAVSVGATTSSDDRAGFSNFGTRLEIMAPGSSIYSLVPNDTYGRKSGTSMATPHVAGLAALILAFRPDFSPAQVQELLYSTADDLGQPGWDRFYGWGRINARRALQTLIYLEANPDSLYLPYFEDENPRPLTQRISLNTNHPSAITWTATISPPAPWLTLSDPLNSSGLISASSSFSLSLRPTLPAAYDKYTTTMFINTTGDITTNQVDITLLYRAERFRERLPILLK